MVMKAEVRAVVSVDTMPGTKGHRLSMVALASEAISAEEFRNEKEIANALRILADRIEAGVSFAGLDPLDFLT